MRHSSSETLEELRTHLTTAEDNESVDDEETERAEVVGTSEGRPLAIKRVSKRTWIPIVKHRDLIPF